MRRTISRRKQRKWRRRTHCRCLINRMLSSDDSDRVLPVLTFCHNTNTQPTNSALIITHTARHKNKENPHTQNHEYLHTNTQTYIHILPHTHKRQYAQKIKHTQTNIQTNTQPNTPAHKRTDTLAGRHNTTTDIHTNKQICSQQPKHTHAHTHTHARTTKQIHSHTHAQI